MDISTEIITTTITGLFGLIGIWLKAKLTPPPPQPTTTNTSSTKTQAETKILNTSKSAKLAALLSFFFPGIGELYLGQAKKGLTIFLVAMILGGGTMGLVWFVAGVYSCFHAHKIACLMNKGMAVSTWE